MNTFKNKLHLVKNDVAWVYNIFVAVRKITPKSFPLVVIVLLVVAVIVSIRQLSPKMILEMTPAVTPTVTSIVQQPKLVGQKKTPRLEVKISSLDDGGRNYHKKLIVYDDEFDLAYLTIDYWNPVIIDTKETFPNLFTLNEVFGGDNLKWDYFLFPKSKPRFIVIRSIAETEMWHLEAFGIYRFDGSKVERVFKMGYGDSQAYSRQAIFSEKDKSFVIDRSYTKNWEIGEKVRSVEHYVWSEADQNFVANGVEETKLQ